MKKFILLLSFFFFQINIFASPEDACTIKHQNNLRSNGSATDKLIRKLPIYTPIIILEEKNDWLKVKGVDFEGWLYSSLVDKNIDCLVIRNTKTPYCFKQKQKLNRRISFNEGFKILRKDVGCNLVESKWGKKIWINSTNIWPESAAKLIQL